MPINPQQAERDLNTKLRLEATLRSRLRRSSNALIADVVASLSATGTLPDVFIDQAEALKPVLRDHYDLAGRAFAGRISDQLPEDVAITDEERVAIEAELAAFFDTRAPVQSIIIASRTARDAALSVSLANQESARILAEGGDALGLREEALIAGTIFSRSLRGRETGIVSLETQAAAEAVKAEEAMVLAGASLSTPSPATHTWVTVGDSDVRVAPFSHRAADSQIRPIGTPFNVGGQQLMYPGDTSLGATAANIVNCRCAAVPNLDEIVTLRRARRV